MGVLDRVVNIDDMRNAARSRLPGFVFEGMERGNGDGNSRNVEALERYRFTARSLEIMKSDIAFNLAMMGCPSVAELGPQFFAPGSREAA